MKKIIVNSLFSAGVGIVVILVVIAVQTYQPWMLKLLFLGAVSGIVIGFLCQSSYVIVKKKINKKPIWSFLTAFTVCGGCTMLTAFLLGERELMLMFVYAAVVEAIVMPALYAEFRFSRMINMQLKKKEEEILSASRK